MISYWLLRGCNYIVTTMLQFRDNLGNGVSEVDCVHVQVHM